MKGLVRDEALLRWLDEGFTEDSIAFRVLTLSALLSALLLLSQAEWELLGEPELLLRNLRAALGFLIGYIYSYVMRRRSLWVVKGVLAFLMIAALFNFFRELSYHAFDPRIPLTNLLIELQLLHSFDLPSHKDLFYSLLGSAILFLMALILSPSGITLILTPIWLLPFIAALHHKNLSLARRGALSISGLVRSLIGGSLIWVLALTTYLISPKPATTKLITLYLTPFYGGGSSSYHRTSAQHLSERALRGGSIALPRGVNLNLEEVQLGVPYSSPGDTVIAKVKGFPASYQRMLAYDWYDGRRWRRSMRGITPQTGERMAFSFSYPHDNYLGEQRYQYFTVVSEAPGVMLTPSFPSQVFFPMENIYLDSNDNVLLSAPLVRGISYTVIFNEQESPILDMPLRHYRMLMKRNFWYTEPYLRTGPVSPEVLRLSEELGSRSRTIGDLLQEIRKLLSSFRYDTNVSFKGDDVLKEFLERKEGYCVHFATATVILLRLNGVPARFVTGYLIREYDPLSGYQLVRLSDGHAWGEVLLPSRHGLGWYIIDTTPLALPIKRDISSTEVSTLISWLRRQLSPLYNAKVRVPILGEQRIVVVLTTFSQWLLIVMLSIIGFVMLYRWLWTAWAIRYLRYASDILKLYTIGLKLLDIKGYPRYPDETLREYLSRLSTYELRTEIGEVVKRLSERLDEYYALRYDRE